MAEPIGKGVPVRGGSGQQVVEGRVYISTVQLGITIVCWRVVSSV